MRLKQMAGTTVPNITLDFCKKSRPNNAVYEYTRIKKYILQCMYKKNTNKPHS